MSVKSLIGKKGPASDYALVQKVVTAFNVNVNKAAETYNELPDKSKFNFKNDLYLASIYTDFIKFLSPMMKRGVLYWLKRQASDVPVTYDIYSGYYFGLLHALRTLSDALNIGDIPNFNNQFEMIKGFFQAQLRELSGKVFNADKVINTLLAEGKKLDLDPIATITPVKLDPENSNQFILLPGVVVPVSKSEDLLDIKKEKEKQDKFHKLVRDAADNFGQAVVINNSNTERRTALLQKIQAKSSVENTASLK